MSFTHLGWSGRGRGEGGGVERGGGRGTVERGRGERRERDASKPPGEVPFVWQTLKEKPLVAALSFPPPGVHRAARWSPRGGAGDYSRSGFCLPPLPPVRAPSRLRVLSELARPRLILALAAAPAAPAARRLHGPGAPAPWPASGASPGRLLPAPLAPVPRSGDADAAAGPGGRRRRCWLFLDCSLPPLPQLLPPPPPVTRPLPFLSSLFASVLFLRLCARAGCTVCFGRSSLVCARVWVCVPGERHSLARSRGAEEEKEPKRRRRGARGRAMKHPHARSCPALPAS